MKVRLRSIMITTLVIGTTGAWIACTGDLTMGSAPRDSFSLPSLSARVAPSANAVARIADTRDRVKWVGQVHTDAMNDFVANREQWAGRDRHNWSRVCAGVVQVVLKYVPAIEVYAGMSSRSHGERLQDVRRAIARARPECRSLSSMSLFGTASSMLPSAQVQDSNATGAYQPYLDSLQSWVATTNGSPSQVGVVTAAILVSASSLPAADFAVVAGAADLVNASSATWTEYVANGGGFGDPDEEQMSIFASKQLDPVTLFLLVDAVGCFAGMLDAWHDGVRNGWVLLGKCVIWGGAASIIYAM